jgi:hypothetical protein
MNLKLFEWLYLGGVVLDVGTEAVIRPAAESIIGGIIVTVIVIALIWAASRKEQAWAAWLLALFALLSVVTVISYFTGGLPTWLNWIKPDTPPTSVQKALDTISALMQVAAIYFYFSGNKART